jgi:predicted metal-binding protein
MPARHGYLFVCTNRREDGHPKGSCAAKGSEALLKALKDELGKQGLSQQYRACGASCLDLCEAGIAVLAEPMHVTYADVAMSDVGELALSLSEGRAANLKTVLPLPPKPAVTKANEA